MKPIIGFIGLGTMGSFMSSNLARSGYPVLGFDTNVTRLDIVRGVGVMAADHNRTLVGASDVILTSLPSSEVFVEVARNEIFSSLRRVVSCLTGH